MGIFYFFWLLWHAASTFNPFDMPWILQNLLFLHTSFWLESFLNISNHWPMKWPTPHLHISLFNLVNPLIFANSCPGWHNYSLWGLLFHFHSQLALKFHWMGACSYFELLSTLSTLHLDRSVMPKPVSLLTVWEAHREYTSLTDLIWARYKQLDSDEYRAVGTPAFNAEGCELANLLTYVSQLFQKLNLPNPKELYRPTFF